MTLRITDIDQAVMKFNGALEESAVMSSYLKSRDFVARVARCDKSDDLISTHVTHVGRRSIGIGLLHHSIYHLSPTTLTTRTLTLDLVNRGNRGSG